ncbi:hypothetical protein [Agarivorans gilvus]|nr:hypothetical protein [Agarivorans gilvus]
MKPMFGKAVEQRRMGLGREIEYLGLGFAGNHHRCIDDAKNIV